MEGFAVASVVERSCCSLGRVLSTGSVGGVGRGEGVTRVKVVQRRRGGAGGAGEFVRCMVANSVSSPLPSSSAEKFFGASSSIPKKKQDIYTVGRFMTWREDLHVVNPTTTVDKALELLVDNQITGLPVVDDNGSLVGVVSDYDLLALDSISGRRTNEVGMFPEAGSTWKNFREVQKLVVKTHGKTIGDVMTPTPLVIREITNLEDAARLLLESKYRRLPVVDESGRLVGLLTRGNVVKAALTIKKESNRKHAED